MPRWRNFLTFSLRLTSWMTDVLNSDVDARVYRQASPITYYIYIIYTSIN